MNLRWALQIFGLSAIWGASFLLIRVADGSFPPLWIAVMRSGLGALLLWTVLLLQGKRAAPRQYLGSLVLVGLFNNAIPFTCFAWGEQVVPSNTAAVLNATTPIWTLLIAAAASRTRPLRNVLLGVALGFAGVVLVVLHQTGEDAMQHVSRAVFLRGVVTIAVGALGYAVASVIAKAKLQGLDPIVIAASQLGFAFLLVTPVALLGPAPHGLRWATVGAVSLLGFAGSGLAYLIFFHILRTVPATHAVAVTYLLPVWGVFWGALAHEPIGVATVVGVVVTIAGLVWMNLKRTPAPVAAPSEATATR
jgi:drug/metabolite transporter (DMT)-like permease